MPKYIMWTVKDLAEIIQKTVNNKFDYIIMIDGKRGLGKSTLGAKILYRLGFNPKSDIVYSREDVIKAFAKKEFGKIFADEMVNVSYGRDFWESDQKTLNKLMNMYRDSCNVFVGCIPIFSQLDKHFQQVVKMRLTVISRGLAIVHRQLSSMYTNDPWDLKNNQKVESKYIIGKDKPKYDKLSTFMGIVKFGDLTENQRVEIDAIKKDKRSKVVDVDTNDLVEESYVDKLMERILNGTMTSQLLRDYCQLTSKKYETVRNALNRKIKEDPVTAKYTLNHYLTKADKGDAKPKKKFNI